MKKIFTHGFAFFLISTVFYQTTIFAQVSITSSGTAFTQNFDGMGATGTTTPAGWFVGTSTAAASTTVVVGTGSSNSGGNFNFGVAGTNLIGERALGSLAASSTVRLTEARFVNNTGGSLASITISYDGEQWRLGQTASNETGLVLNYSADGTTFSAMGTSYNFTPPITTGTAGALDGNASANRIAGIGGTYTPSSPILNGATFYLRWSDIDNTGSDAASGIDNFSITAIAAISTNANLSNLTLSAGTLSPAFASATTTYTSSVANSVTSMTVTPTASQVNATIKVNNVTVASGSASGNIALSVGSNTITTVVTAQDGTTTKTYTTTVTRAAAGTPILTTTSALADFGIVCINSIAGPNSFKISGDNLDGTDIVVAALTGFSYSLTSAGIYTSTLNIAYTTPGFTDQPVFVKFNPTVVQSYDENIILNGGGVSNYKIPVTGSGINTKPTLTTGSSTVTATTATVSGNNSANGCTAITSYGFEYSTQTGFLDGDGTQVLSTNLSGGNFSATITGLAPNTRYYYKAFATNNGGTTYGAQLAFTNTALPVPMAAQPGLSFTETFADIANWSNFFISGIGANHFSSLGATGAGGIPNGTTLTAATFSFQNGGVGIPSSSGGVHRGTDQAPPSQSIVLLSTGGTDNSSSAAIDFFMDFSGVSAGSLSFDYAVVNNSTGNRNGSLRVYYSIDGITFIDIPFASVLNFTNNIALSGTKSNITLPTSFTNNPNARLRFYYNNGNGGVLTGSETSITGSRPKISIDNLNVTALANVACVQPTAPATNLVFGTKTDTTIVANFTAANPATDSYLIVMSTSSTLTGNPVNSQNYSVGDNVGDGTVISKGTTTTFTATSLTALTTYYFFVFPMNAVCTGGPLYYTTTVLNGSATTLAGLPPCAAPFLQPSNLVFGSSTTSSINGSFTPTTADQYLVVRSLSSSLGADPVNAFAYNAGDAIGNGIVVQRSSATSFIANNLIPNTNYFFFVFSLNNQNCVNGPAYNITSPLSSNQSTLPLPPCATPTAQGSALSLATSNNAISGTFNGISSADNYLIIKSTNAILGAAPADNVDYNGGDIFGNGTVVSNVSSTTFYATGLTANTQYYFFIFAANKFCSGGTKYNSINPLTGNISTTNTGANNFYFGTLHSHSDYSDGNKDLPGYTPALDYDYAKNSLCMDYLGISEHNHFSTVNNPGNQVSNFHQGAIQADSVTSVNPNFLAMYGMEWGVINNGGHVVVYGDGMNDLWGWETGAGVWGDTSNYDTYVPKSIYTGSTGLFKTVNDNISKNTFATLAHPNLSDYNNLANVSYDNVADAAIVGSAIESGPAFSTNSAYSDPGAFKAPEYLLYFQTLLAKGYHVGPTIDHDNHNTTFGRTTTSRTAIISPVLSKTAIVRGMRNMNFYATQDCDTKVDFSINTKIMGSSLSDRFGPNIHVALSDATTSISSAVIRVMFGMPGSGINAVKIDSAIGSTLDFNDNNLADLSTGYYYLDITNGTSRIVTSPIWYTRNDGLTALPVKLNSFTVKKVNTSAQLDWATVQEINSSYFNIEKSADGRNWTNIARVNSAGNSTSIKNYRAFDNNPFNGINYYRLKQFDLDGKFEYSVVKSISFSKAYSIIVAPNPAKDFINISTTKNQNTILTIQLVDISGKILKTILSADDKVKMNVTGIAKGLYFIKVKDENSIQTQKVIVE